MADIGKDIERPLGQTVRAPRAAGKISVGVIAASAVVLAVVGV
ncbi:MAG: divergent polysaccharide deacetylase family protein, partial [Mesorhizobium sp.]